MNNQDYIRKGVEIAANAGVRHWRLLDEWLGPGTGRITAYQQDDPDIVRLELDALAAQLVRQVDAIDDGDSYVRVMPYQSQVYGYDKYESATGSDRTMNTIKAIVDSGVLQQQATK